MSQNKVLPFLVPHKWKSWDCYSWTPSSIKLVAIEWHLQHFLTVQRSRRAEARWAHLRTSTLYYSLNHTLTAIRNYRIHRRWPLAPAIPMEQPPSCSSPGTGGCRFLSDPSSLQKSSAGSLLTWLPTWIPEFNTHSTHLRALTENHYLCM